MTAAARKAAPGYRIPRSAVWLGAIAPDIPLYLLFVLGLFWFHTVRGMELADVWGYMWGPDGLYFNSPWWKGAHNVFHAPLVVLAGMALGRAMERRAKTLGRWMFWFFTACLLHSVVDIFTHNDDGPLLFWPLNWHVRFSSPISYWDPDHYGRIFAVFEAMVDLILLLYLVGPVIYGKLRAGFGSRGIADIS